MVDPRSVQVQGSEFPDIGRTQAAFYLPGNPGAAQKATIFVARTAKSELIVEKRFTSD